MAWALKVLVAVAPVLVTVAMASVGLPGCNTTCGDVTVPYPFGIGPNNCSLPGFNLTCNGTTLLLGGGAKGLHQVTHIDLHNAKVRVLKDAMLNHTSNPAPHATSASGFVGDDLHSGPFVLSYHRNKFIVLGCNIQARLEFKGKNQIITGCSSFCTGINATVWGPIAESGGGCSKCDGNGCCQAKIPLYYSAYDVRLDRLSKDPHEIDQVMQNLVLIAEEGWIERVWCWMVRGAHPKGSPNAQPDLSMIPVLLEFMMNTRKPENPGAATDNTTRCPHKSRSACKSAHSSCHDMNNPFRNGYRCQCSRGYDGNPYLVDGCQDVNECKDPERYPCYGECINLPGTYECRCPRGSHGNSSIMYGCVKSPAGLIIGIGVGSGTTVLIVALSTTLLIRKVKAQRKKKLKQKFFKQNHGQLFQQLVCQWADIGERMIITLEELEKATNNFDKSRELGGGGHGMVYKGILSSQHVVAIKKAKIVVQKEIDEFINEVAILSQVNHRNIVKLIGCCLETEVPLLVYEFIANGALYKHLHAEATTSISWKNRLRIAVETARALTYLHSFVSTPVVHRDIKSPNILLDDNLTVKLSDFGASRNIPIDQEGIHTTVQGTLGYLDPMYHSTGHLTEKSDVYSFGVLLIELLTRKKPVSYRSSQGFGLVNHFVSLLSEGNLDAILDPQVTKEGDGEVIDVALLAAICVKFRGDERPTMRQIEMTLESIQASKDFCSDVTDDDISSEGTILGARTWE